MFICPHLHVSLSASSFIFITIFMGIVYALHVSFGHHLNVNWSPASHWCLKSIKNWFAIAIVACLKNLDVLSLRIDAQKWTHDTLQDTQENLWSKAYSGLQTYMVNGYIWGEFEKPIATSSWNCSVLVGFSEDLYCTTLYWTAPRLHHCYALYWTASLK